MIENTSQIEKLIRDIDSFIDHPVDIYLIGGGAMLYNKSKKKTKDVDFVVRSKESYDALISALKNMGFESIRPTPGMERTNISDMLSLDDYRIDIFESRVCGMLGLSDGMADRSTLRIAYDKTRLFTCSSEDIFVFKSVTERTNDYEDCLRLIFSHDFDWTTVLNEIRSQYRAYVSPWVTYTTETVIRLSEEIDVPIRNEMIKIKEEYMEQWASQFEKAHLD